MNQKRGNVWLGVSGLVISAEGKWLVVKKRYGGLKGKWSLPAGFVDAGETADEAVLREIKEETGIDCKVKGLLGLRTGVINEEISDNMAIFLLDPFENGKINHQENELYEACFITPDELMRDPDSSVLLKFLISQKDQVPKPCTDDLNPGDHFGYKTYKLFY